MKRRINRPEEQLHRAVVDYLRVALPEDGEQPVAWWHCPNGGGRSKAEAGIFKVLGVKAGQPDLEFVRNGRWYGIELKPGGRKLSEAQKQRFWRLSYAAGEMIPVARTVEEVASALERWGFKLQARPQ